jgi:hypothetical protein
VVALLIRECPKPNTMKQLIALVFLTFMFSGKAQTWETYYSDDRCSIQYTLFDYQDNSHGIHHKRFIFKYANHTSEPIVLQFERKLAYNNVALESSKERHFSLELAPLEAREYNAANAGKTYYIFVRDENETIKQKLSAFEIINLTTTER